MRAGEKIMDLEKLVDELTALNPDAGSSPEELRKTLEALLEDRPEVTMDADFREKLKDELLRRYKSRKHRRRIGFVLSGSAAAVLLVAGGIAVSMWSFAGGVRKEAAGMAYEETSVSGLNPEGPPGMEGQAPPAYKDLSGLVGNYESEALAERGSSHVDSFEYSGENYAATNENSFLSPLTDPFSTFSVDVDTASYANLRRYLNDGVMPPAGAVRIEELVNYFDYDYPAATGEQPFSISTELTRAPWSYDNLLLRIGLKGREIPEEELPPSNLVFLLDVSGSMNDPDKLPLLKRSLALLVDRMDREDRISIVVYAGAAGVVLEPTRGDRKADIMEALEHLNAGGSTAGGEGIELAYNLAEENFSSRANNRIILATDGDFNVGTTSEDALVQLIESQRESGIFLTVLGFGTGNLQDSTMELLADRGNGNFAYIDSISEARKVLVREMGSTLHTIASDVKLQLEFNPGNVGSYRLIGYENRMLATADFTDDSKDAGEIGSGHTVTALYEIIPADAFLEVTPSSRYLEIADTTGDELGVLSLRWKEPGETRSSGSEHILDSETLAAGRESEDHRFAASVAQWGMLLGDSYASDDIEIDQLIAEVRGSLGDDPHGYRAEFLTLLYKTRDLLEEESLATD